MRVIIFKSNHIAIFTIKNRLKFFNHKQSQDSFYYTCIHPSPMKFSNPNSSKNAAANTQERQHPLQDYLKSLNALVATEPSSGRSSSSTSSISSSSSLLDSAWKDNKLHSKLVNLIDCTTLALVNKNDFVNAHDDFWGGDHFGKSPYQGQ
jgi:hypothetical protein